MTSIIEAAANTGVQVKNRILAALPSQDFQRILAKLEIVNLVRGTVLCDLGGTIRHAYFVNSGMTSLVATTESGASVEVAIVANEGLIGMPAVLGKSRMSYRVLVQIPGSALKISVSALEGEIVQSPSLHSLLMKYMHALHCQVSQSAVCNRFHSLEQRLCRWLLTAGDRVGLDRFSVTHEMLAHLLGSTRTPVTLIAGALQKEGLISYHRGLVRVLNRSGLESAACECYRIVKEDYDHLFDS